jgi:DNA-binding protein HU-beta
VGFGTFSVRTRAGRKGRNPRTGQDLMIPARRTLKFSAGKGLQEAVKPPPQG